MCVHTYVKINIKICGVKRVPIQLEYPREEASTAGGRNVPLATTIHYIRQHAGMAAIGRSASLRQN